MAEKAVTAANRFVVPLGCRKRIRYYKLWNIGIWNIFSGEVQQHASRGHYTHRVNISTVLGEKTLIKFGILSLY
jgi:hypothetical protein